jgi:hemoglobin
MARVPSMSRPAARGGGGRGRDLHSSPMTEQTTLFEQVGGQPFFDRLVDRFYQGVEADDVLLRLYPDHADLVGARRRLALFLAQYWGGPTTYSDERGHPRLRARHFPFSIGALERDRWLAHMREAIDESDGPPDAKARLQQYVTMAADAMRNRDEAAAG